MKYKCTQCPGELETFQPPAPGYPCCFGVIGYKHTRSVMVEVKEPGMNYEPMWAVVDAHRHCADELERTLREITGDRPAPEVDDRVDSFNQVLDVLREVRGGLLSMANREGHNVRRQDAARCYAFSRRCEWLIDKLTKAGEL